MPNQLSINDEFLRHVENLIEANLENEQFGVNELADELGVSRSHLHRKLNSLVGKSTSQFIREYRLEKAMVMLQDNVATASEIAYRVGFGSPTYFNTCFSEYYGYPPGEVKYRNEKAIKGGSSFYKDKITDTPKKALQKTKRNKLVKQFSILTAMLGAIVLIGFLYIILNPGRDNKELIGDIANLENQDKSLAVLPFKNLSNDESNQYFADGMRDDIINHLSKIKSILVKSRQSSDRYGSTDLSMLEIGEALEVDYILDGSVQKYDDKIKIIVHLTDAKNDSQIWSESFHRNFDDIFQIESEISKEIASEMNLVLTPSDEEVISKIPTQHIEAYNLYLKGKYFFNLYIYENEKLRLAEKYFNESIALDPEFALAYSGLAILYFYRGWPNTPNEDYLKSKSYALKALELDSDLAEVHRVLGIIYTEYDWDWELAEKEFKIALEKGPYNCDPKISYAEYLIYIIGDFNKARELIDSAKLNCPLNYFALTISADLYLINGQYDLALEETEKAKEISHSHLYAEWVEFLAYAKKGQSEKAVNVLVSTWNAVPEFKVNVPPMLQAYEAKGIDGIFEWINELDTKKPTESARFYENAYMISQKFAYLGDYERAIFWLEKAYERKNTDLFRIKHDQFFKDMHSIPEFLSLLEKMNLGNYKQSPTFKD